MKSCLNLKCNELFKWRIVRAGFFYSGLIGTGYLHACISLLTAPFSSLSGAYVMYMYYLFASQVFLASVYDKTMEKVIAIEQIIYTTTIIIVTSKFYKLSQQTLYITMLSVPIAIG